MFSLPPLFGDKPTVFEYGKILTAIVNFFLVSLAIYLFIIIPMNKLTASLKKEEAEAPPAQPSEEILLLREIRDSLAIRRAVANKAALGRVYNWTTPTPAGRSPQRAGSVRRVCGGVADTHAGIWHRQTRACLRHTPYK